VLLRAEGQSDEMTDRPKVLPIRPAQKSSIINARTLRDHGLGAVIPQSHPRRWRRMLRYLKLSTILVAGALAVSGLPASAQESAVAKMQAPGPEAERLAQRAGTWDLVLTMRPSPNAEPIVWRDLIAERRMVGLFLEETIRPAPGSSQPDFRRIAYLTYNKLEGRWQYVSLDTRFPAGIMPAYSTDRGSPEKITLEFESLAFAGWGETVDGWMLRSSYVVSLDSQDAETARQYWTRADGSGTRWMGVEYKYARRK
jgi:hypothetical protein